jgi:hypothetical protein
MTPFVLAAAGLIVALVMVIASRTCRYILFSATIALVVCLVAFPRARLCVGQAATSVASKFVSTFNPGAMPDSGQPALASDADADQGDAPEGVADDDSGQVSDSQEKSNLIVEAYGAGASGELVNLLADQGRTPVQKLMGILKLASSALLSPAAADDEDTTESEPGVD